LQRSDSPSDHFKTQVQAVFRKYMDLVSSWERHRVSPVEFVMIALLVSNHINESPDVLSQHVRQFRKTLKAAHKDLRTNSAVLKTAYNFIENCAKTGTKRKKDDRDDNDSDYRGSPPPASAKRTLIRQKKSTVLPSLVAASSLSGSTRVSSQPGSPITKQRRSTKSSPTALNVPLAVGPVPTPVEPTAPLDTTASQIDGDIKPNINMNPMAFLRDYQQRKRGLQQNQGSSTAMAGSSFIYTSAVPPSPSIVPFPTPSQNPPLQQTTPVDRPSVPTGQLQDWFHGT